MSVRRMRRQNSNSSETWDVYHNIENNIRSKLTRKFADIVMNSISKLVQETTHPKMKIQLIDINPYVAWKTGKFYFGNKKFLHFCSQPYPPPTPLHWATSCEEGGGKGMLIGLAAAVCSGVGDELQHTSEAQGAKHTTLCSPSRWAVDIFILTSTFSTWLPWL